MHTVNSYDPTKYYPRFYKELGCQGGYQVRLEVHKYVEASEGDFTLYPLNQEIAYLSALSLSLEGNGEIDDPITKSTLQFSIVEDVFKSDTLHTKYNDFTELFTPDATAYLVILRTRTDDSEQWLDRWRGYITPDSWEEDLDAYGQIHITARDNIGHLADIDFDYTHESDTITIENLIIQAMARIAMPMELRINTDNDGAAVSVVGGDVDVMRASVSLKAFEGKSWLVAVEDVLASLGMTMRYTDNASVTVMHLANLPLYGSTQEQMPLAPLFHGGSKMLVPAYREITSVCDYGAEPDIEIDLRRGLEYGEESIYNWSFKSTENDIFDDSGTGTITPIVGTREEGWLEGSRLMKPAPYIDALTKIEGEETADLPLIAANDSSGAVYAAYRMLVGSSNVTLKIKMSDAYTFSQGKIGRVIVGGTLYTTVYVMLENDGVDNYWDGKKWSTDLKALTFEGNDIEIALTGEDIKPGAAITVFFDKVEYKGQMIGLCNGIYARVLSFIAEANAPLLEKDTITTINSESYNVKADRELAIGAMSQKLAPFKIESYPNALWDLTSHSEFSYFPYQVFLGNDHTTTYPLPAIVHRELLMFHHLAHPMLSGNCSVPEGARFDRLYTYKGVDHILQGGTLDLLSGQMDITLRGFISYDELWGVKASYYLDSIGRRLADSIGRALVIE